MSYQFLWVDLVVVMLVSRALNKERSYYTPNSGSYWLKGGRQNHKEWRDRTFLSKIIHGQMKTMLLGNNMHVMTQCLRGGDGPHLPHSLSVVNTYTGVISGNKWVVVVVKNLTAIPITITKGVKVALVVAANVVLPAELAPRTLEELDEVQGIQLTMMSVERRKEVLLQQLDLSGLVGKPSSYPCLVSWLPWHFLIRAQRTRLYWPSKTWDQDCRQWVI